jgi:hypothetical protein
MLVLSASPTAPPNTWTLLLLLPHHPLPPLTPGGSVMALAQPPYGAHWTYERYIHWRCSRYDFNVGQISRPKLVSVHLPAVFYSSV